MINWDAVSAIGTTIAWFLVIITLIEMRKQRKMTYQSQIVAPIAHFYIERTKSGLPIIFKKEPKLIIDKINSDYSPNIEIDIFNVGFGAACNVEITCEFKLLELMEFLSKSIEKSPLLVARKAKGNDEFLFKFELENDKSWIFFFSNEQKIQRFPVINSNSKIEIDLPENIKNAINVIVLNKYLENSYTEIACILPMSISIKYTDISGANCRVVYKTLRIESKIFNTRKRQNYASVSMIPERKRLSI